MKFILRKQLGLYLINAIALIAVVAFAFLSGCDKTLDGEQIENKAPVVEFVNIPPGPVFDTVSTNPLVLDTVYTRFSRNPLIYWSGSDADGQIDYYRYMVKTEDELGGLTPEEFIETILQDSTGWKYLDVVQTVADPQTSDVVKLKALSDDPLVTYLVQYVFLQAFDEMGKESAVAYRAFSRNDSPPNTFISKFGDVSFINSKTPGVITGVYLDWRALDPDYPGNENVPPFDFQWRLYGPFDDYVEDDNGDQILSFYDKYLSTVYITPTQRVFYTGDSIEVCDTSAQDSSITCSTYVVGVDEFPIGALPGTFSQILDVDKIDAENDPAFNKLVDSSDGWTNDSSLTMFDVYKNYVPPVGGDTTVEMSYVFWVKSRDDALVEDLVPDYESFKVINPRFERDVVVMDFNPTGYNAPMNSPVLDRENPEGKALVSREFWKSVVDNWGEKKFPGEWDDSRFDIELQASGVARDYLFVSSPPIVSMLKHKVVILYYDEIFGFSSSLDNVYDAIDAGVNVWLCMRNSIGGSYASEDFLDRVSVSGDYSKYFAVNLTNFSNWGNFAQKRGIYIQDFVGAISDDKLGGWPNLPLDTALLHKNYMWKSSVGIIWVPEHPAMPEVNWMGFIQKYPIAFENSIGYVYAEPVYLYNSKLNQDRAEYGFPYMMEYQGSPVGHLVDGPYFKTVHFSFTPLALQPDSFKIASDRVLNYLYEEDLVAPVTKNRYR